MAAEVLVEAYDRTRPALGKEPLPVAEDLHVCSTEAIDGLLGVAHRAQVAGIAAAQELYHAHLLGVRVLELVDHHEAELLAVQRGDLGVVAKRSQREREQVVVVERACRGLASRVAAIHLACKVADLLGKGADAGEGHAESQLREGRAQLGTNLPHGRLAVGVLGPADLG